MMAPHPWIWPKMVLQRGQFFSWIAQQGVEARSVTFCLHPPSTSSRIRSNRSENPLVTPPADIKSFQSKKAVLQIYPRQWSTVVAYFKWRVYVKFNTVNHFIFFQFIQTLLIEGLSDSHETSLSSVAKAGLKQLAWAGDTGSLGRQNKQQGDESGM